MQYGRPDYDRASVGLIPADEPVFLIRGQDLAGPATIRSWATQAFNLGADEATIRSALDQAEAMEVWQRHHGGKVPDLPADTWQG